jgi:hypothetical protein
LSEAKSNATKAALLVSTTEARLWKKELMVVKAVQLRLEGAREILSKQLNATKEDSENAHQAEIECEDQVMSFSVR